jgi:hypothetical protein
MNFSARHLKRYEQGFINQMPANGDGLVGRECPNPDCRGYFKKNFYKGRRYEKQPVAPKKQTEVCFT